MLDIIQGISRAIFGDDGIVGSITKYFPPSMSDQEKAAAALAASNAEHEWQAKLQAFEQAVTSAFNSRIQAMEGTASDLQQFGFLGRIVVFLRGMQRPAWGFGTLVADYLWFTEWASLTDKQETALLVINVLVLSFLFGERAFKNVAPLVERIFYAKGGA